MSGSGSRVGNAPCSTCPAMVQITHPTHPLRGQSVPVLRTFQQKKGIEFLIEWPDGQVSCIPQNWTDQVNSVPVTPGSKFTVNQLTLIQRWVDGHLRKAGLDRRSEIISPEKKHNSAGGNDGESKPGLSSPTDCMGRANASAATTTCGTTGKIGTEVLEDAGAQSATNHNGDVS